MLANVTQSQAPSNKETNHFQARKRAWCAHCPWPSAVKAAQPLQTVQETTHSLPDLRGLYVTANKGWCNDGKQNRKTEPALGDKWFLDK